MHVSRSESGGSKEINGKSLFSAANPQSTTLDFFFDIGAIIVTTGWQPYDLTLLPEYGGVEIPDVVDALTFEKMLASGDQNSSPFRW